MTKANVENYNQISVALEECIGQYIAERRSQIPQFVAGHFSIQETIEIQKRTFMRDALANPLNSLWSIPYLTMKKIVETLDKQGVRQFTHLFQKIPSGIKTGYQNDIEQMVAQDFLQWNPGSAREDNLLLQLLHNHSDLKKTLFTDQKIKLPYVEEFREVLDHYSTTRASIADLAGSLLTVIVGWIYFGDKTLGILGIGDRIARQMAKDKAASQFFLGKGVGSKYYSLFPPQPTSSQVLFSTLAVVVLLTLMSLIASALSDPLRKKLGLQEKKLHALLDDLETILLVQYKRRLKIHLRT